MHTIVLDRWWWILLISCLLVETVVPSRWTPKQGKRKSAGDDGIKEKRIVDVEYWVEVWLESSKRHVHVDVVNGLFDQPFAYW